MQTADKNTDGSPGAADNSAAPGIDLFFSR